jgi:mono/diheme cytochrome c family protein
MSHTWMRLALAGALALLCSPTLEANAADAQIERGKYLANAAGCTDCHTPGYFLGKPDMARFLGGSDVGFFIPGLGVFYGPNLTPDKETGLGKWTKEQIVTAITTGKRPDGRVLAPVMPWQHFAELTQADSAAIAAYLASLPAVANKAPGPFAPGQKVTSLVFTILPPDAFNSLPPPPPPPAK